MALTHKDICDKLKQYDEITLMEVLGLTSEDLIERFQDKIEEKRYLFEADLED